MGATSWGGSALRTFFTLAAIIATCAHAAPAPRALNLSLPRPALELIRDDAAFLSFARQLCSETDRLLQADSAATAEERKQLLGLRAHLALCLRQDDVALRVADRLRELQTDPGERAHSGLLTRALVESKRDPIALERSLLASLNALPRDPATRAAVARSAARLAAMSEASLVAEVRDVVAPKLAGGGPCTLELADQIVRAGHRLRNILPLRPPLLRAYEAALAGWR